MSAKFLGMNYVNATTGCDSSLLNVLTVHPLSNGHSRLSNPLWTLVNFRHFILDSMLVFCLVFLRISFHNIWFTDTLTCRRSWYRILDPFYQVIPFLYSFLYILPASVSAFPECISKSPLQKAYDFCLSFLRPFSLPVLWSGSSSC